MKNTPIQTLTTGQRVYTADLHFTKDNTIKRACVTERIVTEFYPDYCKEGNPRYALAIPKNAHIKGAGMAYNPEIIFTTKEAAGQRLKEKMQTFLASITQSINAALAALETPAH